MILPPFVKFNFPLVKITWCHFFNIAIRVTIKINSIQFELIRMKKKERIANGKYDPSPDCAVNALNESLVHVCC